MITPGTPGYSLNRILFAPKNEQEKRIAQSRLMIVRNVSWVHGSDSSRVVSPVSGSSVWDFALFARVDSRMELGVRSGGWRFWSAILWTWKFLSCSVFVKQTNGFEGGLLCVVDSKKSVILHLFCILPVLILRGVLQLMLWVVQNPSPFFCLLPLSRRSLYPTVYFRIFMLLLFSDGFDRFLSASK